MEDIKEQIKDIRIECRKGCNMPSKKTRKSRKATRQNRSVAARKLRKTGDLPTTLSRIDSAWDIIRYGGH